MSRPVIIRNGANPVNNVKDKTAKAVMFGNQFHMYLHSLDIPTFDLSSEQPGGIVSYNSKLFGIVVVPQYVTGDNSIRIMAVPNMSGLHPSSGSYYTTGKDNENKILTGFLYRDGLTAYSYNSELYNILYEHYNDNPSTVSSSDFYDGFATHRVWLQLTDSIGNFPNWRKSEEYLLMGKNQAGPDISASYHGARQERGYSDGNMCCWRFSPISEIDTTGYWYIPSYRELRMVYLNLNAINNAFAQTNSLYNTGINEITYDLRLIRTSDYDISTNRAWGGSCGKYDIRSGSKTSSAPATVDPNMVRAFCKLIKNNGKWILDPTYHID